MIYKIFKSRVNSGPAVGQMSYDIYGVDLDNQMLDFGRLIPTYVECNGTTGSYYIAARYAINPQLFSTLYEAILYLLTDTEIYKFKTNDELDSAIDNVIDLYIEYKKSK